MGLIVDIAKEHSQLKTALTDLYLRFDWVKIYPKYGIIKFVVAGYYDVTSGQALRAVEYEQNRYIDSVFQTNAVEVVNGELLLDSGRYRDQMSTPGSSPGEPIALWRDVYSMKIGDLAVENFSPEVLYPRLYEVIKVDPRFTNIRNELSTPASIITELPV